MKHLFFDLDDFLVRTSHLAPYRLNAAGRRFVAQNPLSVSSSVIGDMKTVVDQIDTIDSLKFHVLTNSASDYAKALLEKHEFPDSVIIANAQKPNSATFKKFLQQENIRKEDALILGDSATDMLAAHDAQVVSLGIPSGYSTQNQLELAESTLISTSSNWVSSMNNFIKGEVGYLPRRAIGNATFLTTPSTNDLELRMEHARSYYPVGHHMFRQSHSGLFLRFKDSKNYSVAEINAGAKDLFFYQDKLVGNEKFLDSLKNLSRVVSQKIDSLNLLGKTAIVAIPNSSPEYCYKTDMNHVFAQEVAKKVGFKETNARVLQRIIPSSTTHISMDRTLGKHYKSMSVNNIDQLADVDNVILFDDIATSGNTLEASARIVRELGNYNGNLVGFAIGKTTY